jgi:hypothetical protein
MSSSELEAVVSNLTKELENLVKALNTQGSSSASGSPTFDFKRDPLKIAGNKWANALDKSMDDFNHRFNNSFSRNFKLIGIQLQHGAIDTKDAFNSYKKLSDELVEAQQKINIYSAAVGDDWMTGKITITEMMKSLSTLADMQSILDNQTTILTDLNAELTRTKENYANLSTTELQDRFDEIERASLNLPREFEELAAHLQAGGTNIKSYQNQLLKIRSDAEKYQKAIKALQIRIENTTDDRLRAELESKLQTLEVAETQAKLNKILEDTRKAYKVRHFLLSTIENEMTQKFGLVVGGLIMVAEGFKKILNSLVTGVGNIAKSLMQGNGFEAVEQGFSMIVDTASGLVDKISKGFQIFGTGLSVVNPLLGGLVVGISTLVGGLSEAAAEIAKQGFGLLISGAKKLIETYQITASSGAIFARGMTEMREYAGSLQISLEDLSKLMKESSADLTLFAGTVGAGTKRLAEIAKGMGGSGGLREQLLNLGVSIEDQNVLITSHLATLATADAMRGKREKQLIDETGKYISNLKIISALTGEDVKVLEKKARESMSELYMYDELKKAGGDAAGNFKILSSMLEKMGVKPISIMQMHAGAWPQEQKVLFAQSRTLADTVREYSLKLKDGSIRNDEYTTQLKNALRERAPMIRQELANASEGIKQEAIFTKTYKETADSMVQLRIFMDKVAGNTEALNDATDAVKSITTNTDPATKELSKTTMKFKEMQSTLESFVIPALEDFEWVINSITDGYKKSINKASDIMENNNPKIKKAKERAAFEKDLKNRLENPNYWEAPVDIKNPFDALFSIIPGLRYKTESEKQIEKYQSVLPEYDLGGIARGPESGFLATLHGTEAVVPLPDGNSIPIRSEKSAETKVKETETNIMLGQLTSSIRDLGSKIQTSNNGAEELSDLLKNQLKLNKQQLEKLEEQNNKMRDLISISGDILNNSYT